MAVDPGIGALHRYFIWADRMRAHFDGVLRELAASGKQPGTDTSMDIDSFLYMSYWYGGMYVVIEGWRELGLSDPRVDPLLASPYVDLLKRYRHCAFHFQKDYFAERFVSFWSEPGSAKWIRDLREAFSDWFLSHLKEAQET